MYSEYEFLNPTTNDHVILFGHTEEEARGTDGEYNGWICIGSFPFYDED